MSEPFPSVEAYLDSLAPEIRTAVEELRSVLRSAVPDADDAIRYNIPTLVRDGRSVVHYAGWKKHLSVYPAPEAGVDPDLELELARHQTGRGTLRFPLDQPLPRELVTRVAALLSDAAR